MPKKMGDRLIVEIKRITSDAANYPNGASLLGEDLLHLQSRLFTAVIGVLSDNGIDASQTDASHVREERNEWAQALLFGKYENLSSSSQSVVDAAIEFHERKKSEETE